MASSKDDQPTPTATPSWRDANMITDWEFAEVGALLCDHDLRDLALMVVRLQGQLETAMEIINGY